MSTDATPIPTLPGYEILGELGRGAMGVVYKARQVALNRVVALKMILAGSAARESDLIRFQTEAEAAAALQHPNVAQLYEIGRYDGQPYFALEYCSGGSLADRLNDTTLPAIEAATLVRTLALAVQAAHDKGILHRDLKPANVLLDAGEHRTGGDTLGRSLDTVRDGRVTADGMLPKITDFGMAKRFDPGTGAAASNLTMAGTIIGTPSYMAPEQSDGASSVASDVYSLGAILYQCLTGRPPFKGASALDTLMALLDEEPVPPSKLVAKVPPDLEAICLKCLEKPPEKRYASATALAADLERFIDGLPTLARPIGTWGQLVGWARRRPAVAALVGLGFVSLIGFAVLSAGLWRALDEAARQRDRAVNTVSVALGAVDDLLQQEDLPGASDPEMQRQAMLDSVSRSLDKLAQYGGDDRDLLTRGAKAYLRRGRLLTDVAKLDEAAAVYGKAVELARQQLQSHPDDLTWRRELGTALNRLGGTHDRAGRAAEARKNYHEAEEIRRALVVEAKEADDEADLAVTLANRGGLDAENGGLTDDATARFREGRERLTALAAKYPDRGKYQNELARNWLNWSQVLARVPARIEEALIAIEQAKAIWEALVKREPASTFYQTQLANCTNELGKLHHAHGEAQVAFADYQAALKTWREVVARHPKVATFRGMLGVTCSNLGQLDWESNLTEERQSLLEEAVRLLDSAQALPMFRASSADALLALSRARAAADQPDGAAKAIEQAITRYQELTRQYPQNAEYRDRLKLATEQREKLRGQ